MKVIEAVVAHITDWPEEVVCYTQDYDGYIFPSRELAVKFNPTNTSGGQRWYSDSDRGYTNYGKFKADLCSDYKVAVITKEMWENARKKHPIFDIKDGMRVKLRNGNYYIKIGITFRPSSKTLQSINVVKYDNEWNHCSSVDHDVMEVSGDVTNSIDPSVFGDLLWKRQELTPQQQEILKIEESIAIAYQQIQKAKEQIEKLKKVNV